MSAATDRYISVDGLTKTFPAPGREAGMNTVFENVWFNVSKGEFVCLIGHSGCGKTTLLNILAGLSEASEGAVVVDGREQREPSLDRAVVFQSHALMPWMSVTNNIAFAVKSKWPSWSAAQVAEHCQKYIDLVHLTGSESKKPAQLSGGMKQRVGIARALAVHPDLILADEAVSALDVSIQAQILNLFAELQRRMNLTLVFISHDLGVVRHLCRRVAVMYLGRIVEHGPTEAVFGTPKHPYTQALIESMPRMAIEHGLPGAALAGEPPSPSQAPPGCAFHPRCGSALPACRLDPPPARRQQARQSVWCHLYPETPDPARD